MRASHLFWDPYQGLWNDKLTAFLRRMIPGSIAVKIALRAVVLLDSMILVARVIGRRLSLGGRSALRSTSGAAMTASILYLDLGTHTEGRELRFMVTKVLPFLCETFQAVGFEASPDSFARVTEEFKGVPSVRILHRAVVHELPPDGVVRLYKSDNHGIGDSIYREGSAFDEVPALRLSDFIASMSQQFQPELTLLRMNIEGAEFDVLADLAERQRLGDKAGYYGMWDDLGKIGDPRAEDFSEFLSRHRLKPFPFNGRDMNWGIRRWCIRYDVTTSVVFRATNR